MKAQSTGTSEPGLTSEARRRLEQQALDSVLASDLFDRSKSLSKLLHYVCGKYFEGQAADIKEYCVAVEALGRPPDFDPKKDAIVRVEMHRLRRRLREYYANGGNGDPIQIVFGEKGYVPEFVPTPGSSELGPVVLELKPPAVSDEDTRARIRRWFSLSRLQARGWIALALALIVIAAGVYVVYSRQETAKGLPIPAPLSADPTGNRVTPAANDAKEIGILAGRGQGVYIDRDGRAWEGDRYFQGGEALSSRSDIFTKGFDRNIFTGMREGRFEYAIPLKPGSYELELFFAESMYGEGNPLGGGEGSREFEILANGSPLVSTFDILSDAGAPNLADSRLFKDLHPAKDGYLHLSFVPQDAQKALVNAIRVKPGNAGRLNPIRIAARPQPYRDQKGDWWQADRYYSGGSQIYRPAGPQGHEDYALFQGERYGNFSYAVPVPPGKYSATLYFYEYWWGKGHAGGTGARRFDVYCNFRPLLLGFDIVRDGGKQQAVKKTFHGLTPNAQGKLQFAFAPEVNFALVNAIEILDESK